MMRSLLMAVLLLLPGCGPTMQSEGSAPGVTLSADRATARAGEGIELILSNNGAEPVGYNLCSSGMEMRAGETWQPVQVDRMCTMELRILEAGQSARYPLDIPSTAQAGEYRFVTGVTGMNSDSTSTLATGAVRVTG